jgi:hypothetical protein
VCHLHKYKAHVHCYTKLGAGTEVNGYSRHLLLKLQSVISSLSRIRILTCVLISVTIVENEMGNIEKSYFRNEMLVYVTRTQFAVVSFCLS